MLPVAHASEQSVATGAAREALAAVATTALGHSARHRSTSSRPTRFRGCAAATPGSREHATAAHRRKLAVIRSKTWTILSLLRRGDPGATSTERHRRILSALFVGVLRLRPLARFARRFEVVRSRPANLIRHSVGAPANGS